MALPTSTWEKENLPGEEILLYAQDGTPLTDNDGNQLTARTEGTTWTDE